MDYFYCYMSATALVKRTFHEHCIIFFATKRQAHRMHIILGLFGIKAGELHGNLKQAKVRNQWVIFSLMHYVEFIVINKCGLFSEDRSVGVV